MNIKIIERAGYEADDILGTIARNCEKDGLDVSLVSGDRDLLLVGMVYVVRKSCVYFC